MSFAQPWAFVLPVIIILILLIRPRESLGIPFASLSAIPSNVRNLRFVLRRISLFICSVGFLFYLTLAAARPQLTSEIQQEVSSRNIMLALDVSGSMRTRDFYLKYRPTSRLEAVKAVVKEFIEQRRGDRIGMVVFGSNAYLECPLTTDHNLLVEMVNELEVGIAGDGTAIGDGLGIALKRIQSITGDSKAVILLTDGVHTAGTVNPLQAAQVAKDLRTKVHTIGIGSPNTANQARGNPLFGGLKQFEFDETTLREISRLSGGVYFNAANIEELQNVYKQIDALERSDREENSQLVVHELFHEYVPTALIFLALYLVANNLVFPRVPW